MHRENPPEAAPKNRPRQAICPSTPAAFACSGERRAGFISMALNRPVSCNVVLYSFNRSSFQYCPSIHGLSLLR